MSKVRNLLILLVITAVVVWAAAYSLEERDPIPEAGSVLYPVLLERINDINRVDVKARGETFVLERGESGWVAPGRAGYPLDGDKVHKLLVGSSALVRIEPKTSNPELYPRLGVEDPDTEETASVRLTLKAGDDVLADMIVGEGKPAKGDPSSSEYFIREAGQAQSWLVQGTLPQDTETQVEWLSGQIAGIASDRLMQVQITHADGDTVTVVKETPDSESFELADAPEQVEVKDAWRLNDIGRLLSDLDLEDVQPFDAVKDRFDDSVRVVETRSHDGLVVRMQILKLSDDEHLARLSASFDEAQALAGAELKSEALLDAEAVKKEVAALNERWQPWAFRIPSYKASYVAKKVSDLLPEPEPEQEPGQEESSDEGAGKPPQS